MDVLNMISLGSLPKLHENGRGEILLDLAN
jgi:hypothetical protein